MALTRFIAGISLSSGDQRPVSTFGVTLASFQSPLTLKFVIEASQLNGNSVYTLDPANRSFGRKPMKISARNCLGGTIKAIEEGSVNNEVTIELAPGVELTSVVTKASCERLGLKVGDSAYALIKASSVMLGVDE
jgi:molybdate transport system regulatory protein